MDAFDLRTVLGDKRIVWLQATVAAAPGAVALAAQVAETVTGFFVVQPAVLATDLILAIVKPTFQAGLAIAGGRINAANDLRAWLVNPTAAAITPTGSEVYWVAVAR